MWHVAERVELDLALEALQLQGEVHGQGLVQPSDEDDVVVVELVGGERGGGGREGRRERTGKNN